MFGRRNPSISSGSLAQATILSAANNFTKYLPMSETRSNFIESGAEQATAVSESGLALETAQPGAALELAMPAIEEETALESSAENESTTSDCAKSDSSEAKSTSAKSATSTKSATKTTATKKATSKKASAKKATARKTRAKSTAKRTTAKKATAKKSTATTKTKLNASTSDTIPTSETIAQVDLKAAATLIEKVESLIALQTAPESETTQTQVELDRLCAEIETWKQTTTKLDAKADQIVAELAQPKPLDFSTVEKGIAREVQQQLEHSTSDIMQAIERGFDNRLNAIDERVSQLSDLLVEQSENVILTQTAIEGLVAQDNGSKSRKQSLGEASLNQINQLLQQSLQSQNLEFDEQLQLVSAHLEETVADTIEATIECKIEEKFTALFNTTTDSLADSITASFTERMLGLESLLRQTATQQSVDSICDKVKSSLASQLEDRLGDLELNLQGKVQQALSARFEQVESKLAATLQSASANSGDETANEILQEIQQNQEQTERLVGLVESKLQDVETKLSGTVEAIDGRIEKITCAIEGQQGILESTTVGGLGDDVVEQLRAQFELAERNSTLAIEAVDEKLTSLLGKLDRVTLTEPGLVVHTDEDDEDIEDDLFEQSSAEGVTPADHWHRQKEAMLSKYGIDPNYRPVMELPKADPKADVGDDMDEAELATLHNSLATPTVSPEDSRAIESLKEEWTNKVREAEIEVSINRAKLSQLEAELEERQVELDRRAKALEQKYGGYAIQTAAPTSKPSFLERLKLHLGGRKTGGRGE